MILLPINYLNLRDMDCGLERGSIIIFLRSTDPTSYQLGDSVQLVLRNL